MEILRVSGQSNPNSVAGAITGLIKEYHIAELQAVGAAAINQVVKSIAIARGYIAPMGIDLVCVPAFTNLDIDGVDKTGMKFIVKENK